MAGALFGLRPLSDVVSLGRSRLLDGRLLDDPRAVAPDGPDHSPSASRSRLLAASGCVRIPIFQYPCCLAVDPQPGSPPVFPASSRWKISDAVLAGNVSAGELPFLADAGLPATFGKSPVRIVVYIKNIPKRIFPLQKQSRPTGRLCS